MNNQPTTIRTCLGISIIILAALTPITSSIIAYRYMVNKHEQEMVKTGYQQVIQPTYTGYQIIWEKTNNK